MNEATWMSKDGPVEILMYRDKEKFIQNANKTTEDY